MKKITLLLLTFTFFMAACKRNSSVTSLPDIYHYLTESQIQKTPYFTNPDFDTLTFLSNTNDTLIFAKIKTDTSYYKTYDRWCFDCPTQTNYHQTLRNTYQTIKGNGKFEVRHVLNGSSSIVSNARDFIEINFNNSIHFFYDYWIGSKTYPTYIESLTVNNKTYNHAFIKYLNIDFDNPDTVNTSFIIINQDYGVFYKRVKNPLIEFYLIK